MKLSDTTILLTKAKRIAKRWMPYLGAFLYGMRTYETSEVPTAAVDAYGRLYVNPEWIAQWKPKTVAYVLLHEVLHLALSHAKRRASLLPECSEEQAGVWNVAADLCIQQMLARHHEIHEPSVGVKIQNFSHIPGIRPGMSTEAYFGVLWQEQEKNPQGGCRSDGFGMPSSGQQQQQDQQPNDGSNSSQPQDGSGEQEQDGKGQPVKDRSQGVCNPKDCGSSSDGMPKPYEKQVRLADAALVENKMRQIDEAVQQAVAQNPGTVPGELVQSLEARLRPQPDPFDKLKSVVSRSVASPIGSDEWTYRKLSRRQSPDAARMRGVIRLSPECTVVLDTSGSMECGDIKQRAISAVAQGLRKVHRPRVLCADVGIRSSKQLTSMKDFKWVGGGGTDMAGAIEEAERLYKPDCIVCITDGFTGWPSSPTRARLVVGLCADSGCYRPPSWATVVRCYEGGPKHGG